MTTTRNPELEPLDALVGEWTTEATHQAVPGVVVRGEAVFEWLEGEQFLIQRSRNEHPDSPDAIAIIGVLGDGLASPAGSGFGRRISSSTASCVAGEVGVELVRSGDVGRWCRRLRADS